MAPLLYPRGRLSIPPSGLSGLALTLGCEDCPGPLCTEGSGGGKEDPQCWI